LSAYINDEIILSSVSLAVHLLRQSICHVQLIQWTAQKHIHGFSVLTVNS